MPRRRARRSAACRRPGRCRLGSTASSKISAGFSTRRGSPRHVPRALRSSCHWAMDRGRRTANARSLRRPGARRLRHRASRVGRRDRTFGESRHIQRHPAVARSATIEDKAALLELRKYVLTIVRAALSRTAAAVASRLSERPGHRATEAEGRAQAPPSRHRRAPAGHEYPKGIKTPKRRLGLSPCLRSRCRARPVPIGSVRPERRAFIERCAPPSPPRGVSQPLPAAPNGTLPCHHGASNSGQKALYRSYTQRSCAGP